MFVTLSSNCRLQYACADVAYLGGQENLPSPVGRACPWYIGRLGQWFDMLAGGSAKQRKLCGLIKLRNVSRGEVLLCFWNALNGHDVDVASLRDLQVAGDLPE